MRDHTETMFRIDGLLRLSESNGFTWCGHLAEAAIAACEGSEAGRDRHVAEAAECYVASLQRLKLAMEPLYVHLDEEDIRNNVVGVASRHPASFAEELDNCLADFKRLSMDCMVDIVPALSGLREAGDLNLISNGYANVCKELPWGTGAMFVQENRAVGRVKVLVNSPVKLGYHWRPRPTPSVEMIEERLADYRTLMGSCATEELTPQWDGSADGDYERQAMEEQMMRF